MKTLIKTIALSSLTLIAAQSAFAQETGRGDTVLTKQAFHDGVTTVDSLYIDADINIEGNFYTQRNSQGNVATVTFAVLDAAAVALEQKVSIDGDTHIGDEASLSEANVYLTGDMGSVSIEQNYKREGRISLGARSSLNLGNVMVSK